MQRTSFADAPRPINPVDRAAPKAKKKAMFREPSIRALHNFRCYAMQAPKGRGFEVVATARTLNEIARADAPLCDVFEPAT
jgi:hypothetical protein